MSFGKPRKQPFFMDKHVRTRVVRQYENVNGLGNKMWLIIGVTKGCKEHINVKTFTPLVCGNVGGHSHVLNNKYSRYTLRDIQCTKKIKVLLNLTAL